MATKIGIIGSGIVGQTLASGFHKHGYDVLIGTNTPSKLLELAQTMDGKAQVGSFSDAASFGEIVVLATKGTAAEEALRASGISRLTGKTVIDTTNPIADTAPVNGVLEYFTGQNDSLMERLQRLAPDANFVKAFSCVGNALMVNPSLPGGPPTMFICGNEESAKKQVEGVLEQFGFAVVDAGKVEGARAIEPLCILWCIPGFLGHGWAHAFKLLKA